jgi:hypothetical protein
LKSVRRPDRRGNWEAAVMPSLGRAYGTALWFG